VVWKTKPTLSISGLHAWGAHININSSLGQILRLSVASVDD
jgi:hypothetical protein